MEPEPFRSYLAVAVCTAIGVPGGLAVASRLLISARSRASMYPSRLMSPRCGTATVSIHVRSIVSIVGLAMNVLASNHEKSSMPRARAALSWAVTVGRVPLVRFASPAISRRPGTATCPRCRSVVIADVVEK